jgi:hypothetical protein
VGKKEKGKVLRYLVVWQSCNINKKNFKRRSVNTTVKNKNNPWWIFGHYYSPIYRSCGELVPRDTSTIKRVMLSQWFWIAVCYAEPVVVNHVVLCWLKWVWTIVRYAELVVVNHGEQYWASGCGSQCAMLCQWLWLMVCWAVQVVVNHMCYAG